jgi:hypothetical protein
VGAWYTIGLFAGLGVGAGLLLAGLVGAPRGAVLLVAAAAGAAGAVLGFALADTAEAVGGAAGGVLGGAGAAQVVAGALRRGGVRAATALLLAAAAVVATALAFVPGVGYLEAVAVPVLAARLRRRAGGRYAGLRILARD